MGLQWAFNAEELGFRLRFLVVLGRVWTSAFNTEKCGFLFLFFYTVLGWVWTSAFNTRKLGFLFQFLIALGVGLDFSL